MSKTNGNLKVAIRIRPLLPPQESYAIWWTDNAYTKVYTNRKSQKARTKSPLSPRNRDQQTILNSQINTEDAQSFTFDSIYGPQNDTKDLYKNLGQPIVQRVIDGHNGMIFTYGHTLSGKTYTMLGNLKPGILPLSIQQIFSQTDSETSIFASYFEIYNDSINDLLQSDGKNLTILKDKSDKISIQGLSYYPLHTSQSAMALLEHGESNRRYKQATIDDHRARSTTIFKLDFQRNDRASCLYCIDLAGSEFLNEQKSPKKVPNQEMGSIKTLFKTLNRLSVPHQSRDCGYAPMDSNLTRILENSLWENTHISLIWAISPALENYNQTLSTLRFASNVNGSRSLTRIKSMDMSPMVNKPGHARAHSQHVQRIYTPQKDRIVKKTGELQRSKSIQSFRSPLLQPVKQFCEKAIENFSKTVDSPKGIKIPWSNCVNELTKKFNSDITKLRNQFSKDLQNLHENLVTENTQSKSDEQSDQSVIVKSSVDDDLSQKLDQHWGIRKSSDEFSFASLSNHPLDTEESFQNYECNVLSWGSGKDGRLGNDQEADAQSPISISLKHSVAVISCGWNHTAAVTQGGKLYTWGQGLMGQLGHGTKHNTNSPQIVSDLQNMKIVDTSAGGMHTLALDDAGIMYTWGFGESGQLGHGTEESLVSPKQIMILQSVKVDKVEAGFSHSACLSSGRLYTWGCNMDGRLFCTDTNHYKYPIKVEDGVISVSLGTNHSAYVSSSGFVVTSNSKNVYFDDAVSVAWGDNYTLVLDSKGQVCSYGQGSHGRLGNGNNENQNIPALIQGLSDENVIQINAGWRHASAVTTTGKLYMWGFNFFNQLGLDHTNEDQQLPQEIKGLKVKKVSCGYLHTAAII